MMRGHVLRYLGWQVWDRTGPRLLVMLLITAAVSLPAHFAVRDEPPSPEQLERFASGFFTQLLYLGLVIFFHGIVAEDRTRGYFRFYLAKPASPLWFYGQSFVLGVAGMLVFTAGFLAIFSVAVGPAWLWTLLTPALATALLMGGMVFLFSTISARDWLWMIVVAIGATILRHRFPAGASPTGRILNAVLPPNHLVDESTLSAAQWAWIVAWAAGLIVLAMVVLRRRPLGED